MHRPIHKGQGGIQCNHPDSNYIHGRPVEVSWTDPPRYAWFYSQDLLVVDIYRMLGMQHRDIQQKQSVAVLARENPSGIE